VITVHDLIPLLVDTKSFLSIQMRLAMPRVLDRADAIIAISSWTRDTILEMFGSRLQAKITVINNGFDVQAPPTTGLGGHWILTVARGESYKRLEWIAAMAKARPNLDFHVVTDAKGQKRLKSHQKNMMIHVGLSREELNHLYTGARVMIHPSLYEGWCLPAAEGLSRGLKLIYCPGSGIDEVAQYFRDQTTAVHRSEPLEAWITALDDAWSTDTMSRQKNSHLLPEWRHAALETLKIYENLL
jgi:glycosyltransferase involved in cell wall biosynthesis